MSPLLLHADAVGDYPGTQGGVTGITTLRGVTRVTFAGVNAAGTPVTIGVPITPP
jgi:hypothetical protein